MSAAMLFNFQLCPVKDIGAWGADRPSLHWFGLTLGRYWLDVGQAELFRYSPALLEKWAREFPGQAPGLPYDEYQVVRLWEDLLQSLPDILDPLPDDLARHVEKGKEWEQWQDEAWRWAETEGETAEDLCYQALRWWGQRGWDAGYLRHPPRIWLWTVGDTLHLRWDNRDVTWNGMQVWDAAAGEVTMPVAAFVDEVNSFNARFLGAMGERVEQVRRNWPRPDVYVDVPGLEREQADRAGWLASALRWKTREFEWAEVRAALTELRAATSAR